MHMPRLKIVVVFHVLVIRFLSRFSALHADIEILAAIFLDVDPLVVTHFGRLN